MRPERTSLNALRPTPDAVPAHAPGAHGLWHWIADAEGTADAEVLVQALAFRSRDEAIEEHALRRAAPRDAGGRVVLGREHLRRLVSAIALPCADCADVFFGGVYGHPRDADGCNWSVGIMSGDGDHAACMAHVREAKTALRRCFAIPEDA